MSRPVVGDVAAAIRLNKRHAHLTQHVIRGSQIRELSVTPERDHMRVLAQQQHVRHRARFACRDDAPLHFPRGAIFHQAEIDDESCFH